MRHVDGKRKSFGEILAEQQRAERIAEEKAAAAAAALAAANAERDRLRREAWDRKNDVRKRRPSIGGRTPPSNAYG